MSNKPITCAEAGFKGGSARSAKKTAANRANARKPRKKANEAPLSHGSLTGYAKPKQNARQPRLRPKVGQVWTRGAYEWTIVSIDADAIRSIAKPCGFGRDNLSDWLADRKAGAIRIVRAGK